MFRDDIKREFDRIAPSEALTSSIAAMMNEEASKPRKPIYIGAVRAAAAAAAVCLITTVSVIAVNTMKGGSNEITAAPSAAEMIRDEAAAAPLNKSNSDIYSYNDMDGEGYAAEAPEAVYATTAAASTYAVSSTTAAEASAAADIDGAANYAADAADEAAEEREADGEPYDIFENEDACAPSIDSVGDAPDNGSSVQSDAPVGGDGVETEYWFSATWQLSNIFGSYIDAVGVENFEMWYSDTRFDPDFNDYTDIDKFIDLYSFKKHYDISDEEFERMLISANEQHIAVGFGAFYTDDEIRVLAYGTKEEVSERFANDCTVYHNGRLYTVKWFDTHTVEDYRNEGIPAEKITAKLDNMMNLENFNNPETREKFDLQSLNDKLNEYISGN